MRFRISGAEAPLNLPGGFSTNKFVPFQITPCASASQGLKPPESFREGFGTNKFVPFQITPCASASQGSSLNRPAPGASQAFAGGLDGLGFGFFAGGAGGAGDEGTGRDVIGLAVEGLAQAD